MSLRMLALFAALAVAAAPAARSAPAPEAGLPAGTEAHGPEVMLAAEDAVPVRTEPGFVYRELRFLRKGQEVVVDGRKGPWLHIRPEGWILADHLVTREEAEAPPPVQSQRMAAVREGIRVRSAPSTDAAVSRTLAAGEVVEVTGQESGWWQLAGGGYVSATLLRPADQPAAEAAEPQPWVVAGDGTNVRAARGSDAAVVRKLARGEIVAVSGITDGWAQVEDGWIRADLLQAPALRPSPASRRMPEGPAGSGPRRWSLVDLNGVVFEVIDLTGSPVIATIKQEMLETGMLEEDWTFLGLTIGVPDDAPYRFNYAPDKNTTVIVDDDGQKYGNVFARGPIDRLPGHVRQFFLPMVVEPGAKFDGVLLFRPTLKPSKITEISMFIGGRMQKFYATH